MSSLKSWLMEDLEDKITSYDNTLRLLLDMYATKQTRNRTLRPYAPWFSDDLRELKPVKRR